MRMRFPQPFNLQATLESGQAHRWRWDDGWYWGVVYGNLIKIRQSGGGIEVFSAPSEPEQLVGLLNSYFRLDDDLTEIYSNKYHFFNSSRQTRLLGRWVKLSKIFNQKWYLNFIEITNKRLMKSLQKSYMQKIRSFYYKLIPQLYAY